MTATIEDIREAAVAVQQNGDAVTVRAITAILKRKKIKRGDTGKFNDLVQKVKSEMQSVDCFIPQKTTSCSEVTENRRFDDRLQSFIEQIDRLARELATEVDKQSRLDCDAAIRRFEDSDRQLREELSTITQISEELGVISARDRKRLAELEGADSRLASLEEALRSAEQQCEAAIRRADIATTAANEAKSEKNAVESEARRQIEELQHKFTLALERAAKAEGKLEALVGRIQPDESRVQEQVHNATNDARTPRVKSQRSSEKQSQSN